MSDIEVPIIHKEKESSSNRQNKRKRFENAYIHYNKYKEIKRNLKSIEIYMVDIRKRFPKNELNSIVSIYSLIMLKDTNEHSNFDYNTLLKYNKFINIERLKHERQSEVGGQFAHRSLIFITFYLSKNKF